MKSYPTKCNPDVMKVSSQMRPATRPVWGKKRPHRTGQDWLYWLLHELPTGIKGAWVLLSKRRAEGKVETVQLKGCQQLS